jgi:phosphate transport system substrate-binding protein
LDSEEADLYRPDGRLKYERNQKMHNIFKLISKTILCLSIALLLIACGAQSEQVQSEETVAENPQLAEEDNAIVKPQLTEDNYPVVNGSTANIPLMARLYSEICGIPLEDADEKVIASGGTSAVWNSILRDSADLLLVYEAPESLKDDIAEKRLEISPLGKDGLVFLVNAKNSVDDLTTDQLIDIYTGKITRWSKVGGPPEPIIPFQRNEGSGSQTLFLKLLMKDTRPMDPLPGYVPSQMADLIKGVAIYDGSGGAIGYSVFYYAGLMYTNPDIKLLSVDGVAPSNNSIRDNSYPLTNDFYVVIKADEPEDSPARLIRDWLLTEDGGRLLTDSGYVLAS